jgi:hypothetical protein
MSARVTEADIRVILDTQLKGPDLLAYAEMAHVFVNANIAAGALADDILKEIERQLAAHFACLKDPRVHSEHVGTATTTYEGDTGTGLNASRYGQTAKMLDSTGALAVLDAKANSKSTVKVDFAVLTR